MAEDVMKGARAAEPEVRHAETMAHDAARETRDAERLGPVLESAPDAVIVVDPGGSILLVNARTEALFGHHRDDLVGEAVEVILPAGLDDALDRVGREEIGTIFETSAMRRDGSGFPADVTLAPLPSRRGRRFVVAVRDVTTRRLAEDRLRRSEAMFRGLLESAPDAVVIIDAAGSIALVNARTEALFGYAREELVGQSVEALLPERFRDAHAEHRVRYLEHPRARPMGASLELHGRRKDGTEFPVDVSLAPLETEEGTLVTAAIRDVTDRKRLEKMRDQFIADAAHELRTPLAALATLGETMARYFERMSPVQMDRALLTLKRQGRRASRLVANLLDLSQIESGRLRLSMEEVEIGNAVRRVLDATPPPAGTDVVIEVPDDLRAVADEMRLEQVLANLVTNGYRYGGRMLRIEGSQTDDAIRIAVSDEGPGVPRELIGRMFEPFTRGGGAQGVEGSGLGLAISRALVEVFGGSIHYEAGNPGARFVIRLRRAHGA